MQDPRLDAFLDDVVLHNVGVRGNVLLDVIVVLVLHLELVLNTYQTRIMVGFLNLVLTSALINRHS